MKRIVLHIDHLVLRGFRPEDRHAIAAGLQQELARMFADPEASRQLTEKGDIPKLRIGKVNVAPGARPQRIGAQVAQGIGRGMKK